MKFTPTKIQGIWIVNLERHQDERGWFARTWCAEEFEQHCLNAKLSQCSESFNRHRGTLRGMHYQAAPHEEAKLVRCVRGAIFDVALDLRSRSPTFKQWVGIELTEENGRAVYIPEGCAHGFQTLKDNTEVFYMMSKPYVPEGSRGVRWDDPMFGLKWPLPKTSFLSPRDAAYPNFSS